MLSRDLFLKLRFELVSSNVTAKCSDLVKIIENLNEIKEIKMGGIELLSFYKKDGKKPTCIAKNMLKYLDASTGQRVKDWDLYHIAIV